MKHCKLKTSLVDANEGQIPGLPRNPRTWTYSEMGNLCKSLQETPELFEARGLVVMEQDGRYVTLGGNMRLVAAKTIGLEEVPASVLDPGTPTETLREIVIKDNSSFGSWDWDELARNWGGEAKAEWGIPVPAEEKELVPTPTEKVAESNFQASFEPDEFTFVTQRLLAEGDTISEGLLNMLGYVGA